MTCLPNVSSATWTKVYRKGPLLFQRSISCAALCPIIKHRTLLRVTQAHLAQAHSFVLYGLLMLVIILSVHDISEMNLDLREKKNVIIILDLIEQPFL